MMEMPAVVGSDGRIPPREAVRLLDELAARAPQPNRLRTLIERMGAPHGEPLYKDNNVDILIDGPSTYTAMLEAIRGAKHHVHLETYIFASDEVGQQFADALIERCAAGVAVRVIYDAIGSFESEDRFFRRLEEGGAEIEVFHPPDLDLRSLLSLNTRDHRKLLVVDGEIGFTGGINVVGVYSRSSSGPSRRRRKPAAAGWRDTHIAIRGPAVAALQKLFLRNWREQRPELADDGGFFPPPPAAGSDLLQIVHAHGGDGEYSPIYHAYLRAMELASSRIWITQAYFAPDRRFLATLRDAARRGVDVRILLPGVSDVRILLHASRARYGKLLRAGVRFWESRDTMLHAKTAVIDGVWSTVGSSNLDSRSFLHNEEVNVVVLGSRFAKLMEAQFLEDAAQCRPVTLEQWRGRPLGERVLESASRMIDYWL